MSLVWAFPLRFSPTSSTRNHGPPAHDVQCHQHSPCLFIPTRFLSACTMKFTPCISQHVPNQFYNLFPPVHSHCIGHTEFACLRFQFRQLLGWSSIASSHTIVDVCCSSHAHFLHAAHHFHDVTHRLFSAFVHLADAQQASVMTALVPDAANLFQMQKRVQGGFPGHPGYRLLCMPEFESKFATGQNRCAQ